MNILRRRGLTVLALISMGFAIMGSTVVWAAPMLWSYPDDHILISEVQYQDSPGDGHGSEWIEIYNPTNNDVEIYIYLSDYDVFWTTISTPTPLPGGTPVSYPPLRSDCFLYLARDAGVFFNENDGQCPDYATIGHSNCPNTSINMQGWNQGMDDLNGKICLFSSGFVDAVGWGNGGSGSYTCDTLDYPLSAITPSPGETILRGNDVPEWIGPGGEGQEDSGPMSEQLDEVWNLSGDVDVPWEGPEVGACRRPTAVSLKQTPQATTAQSIGEMMAVVGMLGLITCIILAWRREAAQSN